MERQREQQETEKRREEKRREEKREQSGEWREKGGGTFSGFSRLRYKST